MSTPNNKPVDTIRDRELKATIWERLGEKGTFYIVEISRTYKDEEGNYKTSHSYSQDQLLRVARLADIAYNEIAILYAKVAEEKAA